MKQRRLHIMLSKTEPKSITLLGGADGPTSIFVAEQPKPSISQTVHRCLHLIKKKYITYKIEPDPHTMEETISYLESKYDFKEMSHDTDEYQTSYTEHRLSAIMQYAPELLGEYAQRPQLIRADEASLIEFQKQFQHRQEKAEEIPRETFDIDLHIYEKNDDNIEMQIIFESRYGYIEGNCGYEGSSRKTPFDKIYKDIYLYYGVSEADISKHSERYKSLLSALTT